MKKVITVLSFLLIFSAFCFAEKKIYVKTKSADLMKKATTLSTTVTKVSYGAELIVLETDGEWNFVQLSGKPDIKGWIKDSRTTTRKLTARTSANAKEIALSGRGFNEEVENLYSNSENGNYKAVDEIESIQTDKDNLKKFIKDGNLNGGEK
jgi:uncharacterized protein YgiM (DUF1202 family)